MSDAIRKRDWFYTKEPAWESVTEECFLQFIEEYPRRLVCDVFGVNDPPVITYNDFQLANRWPYSVVARTWVYEDDPEHYYYEPKENRKYYIVKNHEELFSSKTGNEA